MCGKKKKKKEYIVMYYSEGISTFNKVISETG